MRSEEGVMGILITLTPDCHKPFLFKYRGYRFLHVMHWCLVQLPRKGT